MKPLTAGRSSFREARRSCSRSGHQRGFRRQGLQCWISARGRIRAIVESASYGRFADGYLVFARAEGLAIAPFDLSTESLRGNPVPTGIEVLGAQTTGVAHFDIGASGVLAYAPGRSTTRTTLVWVDRNGRESPLNLDPGFYLAPNLTRDGRHLVVSKLESANFDIWKVELARMSFTRLTSTPSAEYGSILTPDGETVTYSSNRAGPQNLFSIPTDGPGVEQRLTTAVYPQFPSSWSPDETLLAFDQLTLRPDPTSGSIRNVRALPRPSCAARSVSGTLISHPTGTGLRIPRMNRDGKRSTFFQHREKKVVREGFPLRAAKRQCGTRAVASCTT